MHHLLEYEACNGSLNDFNRAFKHKRFLHLSIDHFYVINRLVQKVRLIEKGLASEAFKHAVDEELESTCDTAETIARMRSIAIQD